MEMFPGQLTGTGTHPDEKGSEGELEVVKLGLVVPQMRSCRIARDI